MGYRLPARAPRGQPDDRLMSPHPLSADERNRLALLFAEICSQAGVAVMDVYNSDFETRSKSDSSPVSDADERAEEIILQRLASELSGVPVLAEEQAEADGLNHRRPGDLFLLVDPVDGTREFVNRKKDFTINIGLISKGEPLAGCVFAPAHQTLFAGGTEAHIWRDLSPGDSVASETGQIISTRAYPHNGLTAVVSSSHLDENTTRFLENLSIAERVSFGSSLKFCRIAEGAADIYPRWGPTMEWDTAAGHAVLNAAGGCVQRPDGSPLTYGRHEDGFRNGPFIAWGGAPVATA